MSHVLDLTVITRTGLYVSGKLVLVEADCTFGLLVTIGTCGTAVALSTLS